MKTLEEHLKDSFDHFEPEVNPSVWTKVSHQLPGSSAPSGNTGSAIKGAALHSGTIASWIAAAAAVITGAGLLYYFGTSEPKTVIQQPPVVQPKEVVTENSITAEPSGTESKKQSQTVPADVRTKDVKEVKNNFSNPVTSQKEESGNSNDHKINASAASQDHQVTKSEFSLPTAAVVSPNQSKEETAKSSESTNTSNANGTVKNLPEPTLIVNTRGGFAPLTVTVMTNQVNQAVDFDFGDGHQAVQTTSASNRYDEPGTYTITCKAGGKTMETTIDVLGQVSSAFSPNGDGVNDLFTIGNNDLQIVELTIFNRSGREVFSGKGKIVSWDGKMQNGSSADGGTYFYDIFVTTVNGITYKQKGTINLFR